MIFYANENRGCLPNYGNINGATQVYYDPIGADIYNPDSGLWMVGVQKYIKSSPRISGLGNSYNYFLGVNFLRCPSAVANNGTSTDFFWTYGVNYGSVGATRKPSVFNLMQLDGTTAKYVGSRKLAKVKPSEFLVCDIINKYTATPPYAFNNKFNPPDTDTDNDGVLDTFSGTLTANKPYGKNNYVEFRHNRQMNYASADGSVHGVAAKPWFANEGLLWYVPDNK